VCDEGLRSWEAVIADAMFDGGVERGDADAFGTFVVATLEGALLVARGRRSTAPMDDAAEQLAVLAETMLNRSPH
jgi:TetR/AcrR family transcriptional repressor of lmrAB and yxaGH operons